MSLLRKELVMVVTENRNLQKKTSESETAFIRKITLLEMEIDLLRLDLAERDRRLEKYKNSDSPSSRDSLYNAERAAFRKRMEREDADEQQGGPEPKDGDKIRKGPPAGHVGISHGNKAEKTVTLHVYKCRACGCRHLSHIAMRISFCTANFWASSSLDHHIFV